MAEKYGIDNVRGGSFCEIELSKNNIATLNQMMIGANDRCYKCGNKGHFARQCTVAAAAAAAAVVPPVCKPVLPKDNDNDPCNCVTSYFSPHRKFKCALKKVATYLDDSDSD